MDATILERINAIAKTPLKAEEVFVFDLLLCDNEVDRDGEMLSLPALAALKERYIGKTGICDHDARERNQHSRIFDTQLVAVPGRKTKMGEDYVYLKASAYLLNTPENQSLIRDINGGIKKEVSISAAITKKTCSICGARRGAKPCLHTPGKHYGGKLCCTILDEVTDVYEWSLVAVPAQVNAGVIKRFGAPAPGQEAVQKEMQRALDTANAQLNTVREELRCEVTRLCGVQKSGACAEIFRAAVEDMSLPELISVKKSLLREQRGKAARQLTPQAAESLDGFQI